MNAPDPALERDALRLLREVLDATPDDRDTRLAGTDPAIAERVRALLAKVEPERATGDGDDVAGQEIGPYRLIERIGRGGMGEVFRAARADGSFDREVALKRIWGGFAPLTERFLRERQVLARLQHPGIAQLFDGGIDARGAPWFAMELVHGQPITTWCDGRQASLEHRVDLMRQVCDAVDVAHRALVVHRDIKPANVMVDADGRTKLLDFGISKLIDEADPHATQTLAMTPAWAAPEQRDGRPVTTAMDIWQLGTLLRVLLSGDLPDPGPHPVRMAAAFERLGQHDPAKAARVAATRSLTPARLSARLRGDLDAIVAQATAHDPGERYPSAAALAEDLQRWRDGVAVSARRTERGYRARRVLRRHWPALAAGALLIVGAAAAGVYHVDRLQTELRRTERARQQAALARDQATSARDQAQAQRERAEATVDYFVQLFKNTQPAGLATGDVTARELLDTGMERLLTDTGRPPLVRASLLLAAGRAADTLGIRVNGLRAFAESVRLLETTPGAEPETLVRARYSYATALEYADRMPDALRQSGLAIALARRTPLRDPDLMTMLHLQAANLASQTGDTRAVREAYADLLVATQARLDVPKVCRAHYAALGNLAMLDIDESRPADSLRRTEQALAIAPRCGIRDGADRLILRRVRLHALIDLDRMDEATAAADALLRDANAHFGPEDVLLTHIKRSYATVQLARGRPENVTSALAPVQQLEHRTLPADDGNRISTDGLLALATLQQANGTAATTRDAVRALHVLVGLARKDEANLRRTDAMRLRFHEVALAYGECVLDPVASRVADYRAARSRAGALQPWRERLARAWDARCRANALVEPATSGASR